MMGCSCSVFEQGENEDLFKFSACGVKIALKGSPQVLPGIREKEFLENSYSPVPISVNYVVQKRGHYRLDDSFKEKYFR